MSKNGKHSTARKVEWILDGMAWRGWVSFALVLLLVPFIPDLLLLLLLLPRIKGA